MAIKDTQAELFPKQCQALIRKIFSNRIFPAYGQIATISDRSIAQVRTVHLRYIKPYNCLAFPSHTQSQKWAQLIHNPNLSGCIFSNRYLAQLRWTAMATLIDDTSQTHQPERQLIWNKMRKDIRQAYWLDYQEQHSLETIDTSKPCPSMGIIINQVHTWDVWKMNKLNYSKSKRTLYQLDHNSWHEIVISPLYSENMHSYY